MPWSVDRATRWLISRQRSIRWVNSVPFRTLDDPNGKQRIQDHTERSQTSPNDQLAAFLQYIINKNHIPSGNDWLERTHSSVPITDWLRQRRDISARTSFHMFCSRKSPTIWNIRLECALMDQDDCLKYSNQRNFYWTDPKNKKEGSNSQFENIHLFFF